MPASNFAFFDGRHILEHPNQIKIRLIRTGVDIIDDHEVLNPALGLSKFAVLTPFTGKPSCVLQTGDISSQYSSRPSFSSKSCQRGSEWMLRNAVSVSMNVG